MAGGNPPQTVHRPVTVLIWTEAALADRRAIYRYLEERNPWAAIALDQVIADRINRLRDHPSLGHPGRVAGTRELLVHRHCIVIYDSSGAQVRVLRLLHTSQDWPPHR